MSSEKFELAQDELAALLERLEADVGGLAGIQVTGDQVFEKR